MNHELSQYARREYRQSDDFALGLWHTLHPKQSFERPPTRLQQKMGLTLQKRILKPITEKRARIFDRTSTSVGEIMEDAKNPLTFVGISTLSYITGQLVKGVLVTGQMEASVLVEPALIAAVATYTYANRDRMRAGIDNVSLHPSKVLGLEPHPLTERELDDDIAYCIHAMNERSESLQEEEKPIEIVGAVRGYMEKLYGFSTQGAQRLKSPRKPTRMVRQYLGRTFKDTGEIVVINPHDHSVATHEVVHTQGVSKESEAELTGVLAHVNADDRRLQYYGYNRWLELLVGVRSKTKLMEEVCIICPEAREEYITYLLSRGLNETGMNIIRSRWDEYDAILSTVPTEQDNGVGIFRKADILFTTNINRLIGRLVNRPYSRSRIDRQVSTHERYSVKPVELLHDYKYKHIAKDTHL